MTTPTTLATRIIGSRTVSAIGLGAMPMSVEPVPDEAQAIATIHAALDAGVTLIDTADAYSPSETDFGHNELLVARALASYGGDTSDVLVATKGGHIRLDGGGWALNGHAEYLVRAAEESSRRLGGEPIGLYQYHRPDPEVPYAEAIGALKHLLDAGTILMAGISNADPDQITLANEILGGRLASVQNQFSPAFRSSMPEIELCAELGIAFLPWSPLGGMGEAGNIGGSFAAFRTVADAHGVSAQQVCLAWELALAPVVIPIPGASRPRSVEDSARAVSLTLTDEELVSLSAT